MKRQIIYFSIFILSISICYAQKNKKTIHFNKHSIENSFDNVYNYSNNYQEFKVVKKQWLQLLKNKVVDSLNTQKIATQNLQTTITSQNQQISSLKTNITNLNNTVNTINTDKDTISFLGATISKNQIKILLWFITSILSALLGFFAFKFKESNVITKQAKLSLKELEEEYEAHRKTALEREQKVRRKLQDEINKNGA